MRAASNASWRQWINVDWLKPRSYDAINVGCMGINNFKCSSKNADSVSLFVCLSSNGLGRLTFIRRQHTLKIGGTCDRCTRLLFQSLLLTWTPMMEESNRIESIELPWKIHWWGHWSQLIVHTIHSSVVTYVWLNLHALLVESSERKISPTISALDL